MNKGSEDQAHSNNLELVVPLSMNSHMSYRMTWFVIGALWGVNSQLAMIGTILLCKGYDASFELLWFRAILVVLFTALNVSGPFAVRFILIRLMTSDGERGEDENAEIVGRLITTKSFISCTLMGSNVSFDYIMLYVV